MSHSPHVVPESPIIIQRRRSCVRVRPACILLLGESTLAANDARSINQRRGATSSLYAESGSSSLSSPPSASGCFGFTNLVDSRTELGLSATADSLAVAAAAARAHQSLPCCLASTKTFAFLFPGPISPLPPLPPLPSLPCCLFLFFLHSCRAASAGGRSRGRARRGCRCGGGPVTWSSYHEQQSCIPRIEASEDGVKSKHHPNSSASSNVSGRGRSKSDAFAKT